MCFAAEDDDLSKKEAEPANDNNSHATPPKSPTPTIESSPATTPTKPTATTVPELNGGTTTPDRKPSPEPKTTTTTTTNSTPEPASETINNVKSNNKHVEELYDIPVGEYFVFFCFRALCLCVWGFMGKKWEKLQIV